MLGEFRLERKLAFGETLGSIFLFAFDPELHFVALLGQHPVLLGQLLLEQGNSLFSANDLPFLLPELPVEVLVLHGRPELLVP